MAGAMSVCRQAGISDKMFLEAIMNFKGASNRLEHISESSDCVVYKDFAHAPSKLKATTQAMKEQFPDRKLIALMELHTFSSLSENFLLEYQNSMQAADKAIVYFNPHALKLKRLPDITPDQIHKAFGGDNIIVMNDADLLRETILETKAPNTAYLFMSSGNFGGLDLRKTAEYLTGYSI
jgi:UDP-N-acetylmuramate: L-alanyl-gamma-D-glutamyl-meso-diaminopimelate ligase